MKIDSLNRWISLDFRRIEDDLKSPVNPVHSSVSQTRSPELIHKPLRQDSISSDLSNLTVDSDGKNIFLILFL